MLTTSKTFVLTHGAWCGGWCWRRVADLLEAKGHKVYTPTLTGLGERSHLINGGITLDTHIMDVVNLFAWEQLTDVVLVSHSYGGFVASGAIERVQSSISAVAYVDAFLPQNGESLFDLRPKDQPVAQFGHAKDEIGIPPPPARAFNVNQKDQAWVDAKMTPQPIGTFTSQITLSGARNSIQKKAYIRSTGYENPRYDSYFAAAKADPAWRTAQIDSGHAMMIDAPTQLADTLVQVA